MMLGSNNVSFSTTYTIDTQPRTGVTTFTLGDPVEFSMKPVWFHGSIPKVSRVIFNPPATILFFADGDKVVVKCQEGRSYDPFDGVANAMLKKIYTVENRNYKSELRKLVKMGEKPEAKSK